MNVPGFPSRAGHLTWVAHMVDLLHPFGHARAEHLAGPRNPIGRLRHRVTLGYILRTFFRESENFGCDGKVKAASRKTIETTARWRRDFYIAGEQAIHCSGPLA